MKFNQKLAALFLVSAGALSTQAVAHESGLEQIVSNLVSNTMNNVSFEIQQQVENITLSASNVTSYDASESKVGNVVITDLANTDVSETKDIENNNSENDNQNENTDD